MESRDDIAWLLRTTNQMVRCGDVATLLELAYDAIREGLGFDRVGLLLVDGTRSRIVVHIGTDEQGHKHYPRDRWLPLTDGSFHARLLADPRMTADGPGFVYLADIMRVLPPDVSARMDGSPSQNVQVSLRCGGQVLGLISVDNLVSGRPVTERDAPPLVALANALAVAVENVRLLEERNRRIAALDADLRRRVAELEWLRDISHRVNAARDFEAVLDIVYDGLREGLTYDRVGIQLFDHARGLWVEHRGTDPQGRKLCPRDRTFSLEEGASSRRFLGITELLDGADYFHTDDAVAATPPDLRFLLDGAPRHYLSVPLRTGGTVTGMISVDNLLSDRPIVTVDIDPLIALANQLGTAIENARLLALERADRERLRALLESARALNATLDRDQILHELAGRLVDALGATRVVFSRVDLESRTFVATTLAHGAADGAAVRASAPSGPALLDDFSLIEQVARDGRPVRAHAAIATSLPGEQGMWPAPAEQDVWPAESASPRPGERDSQGADGLCAELLVPVAVRGEGPSVLQVQWSRPVALTADTVALCTAIAEQVAVALENARLYADAATRAEHDALTGLLNHRALLERLDAVLAGSAGCAVLLIDVDNFKLFNDTYGHPVGDGVLVQIAAMIRDICREADAAGRYGGDEFALLLPGAAMAEAASVMRRLERAVVSRPFVTPEGAVIPLAVSIGVACAPVHGRSRQELLAVADAGMYAAKRRATPLGSALGHVWGHSDAPPLEPGSGPVVRHAADLLGDSPFGVLEGLVNAVDAKDRYTREHSESVAHLALLLAEALDLAPAQRRVLAIAGRLHDVGKIAVPDAILRKPGRLTAPEYDVIKQHVAYGVAIIRGVLDDGAIVDAIAYHHERWDGAGYPHGLAGPETPLLGRVMQIADAASAMLLDRPYRQGMTWACVRTALLDGAGAQFDPQMAETFVLAADRALDRSA